MKKAETVSCAPAASPCKDRAIAGSAGRYMSMDTGPKPVSAPSKTTSPNGAFTALASPWSEDACGPILMALVKKASMPEACAVTAAAGKAPILFERASSG